jgi:hypothetical protein
MKQAIRKHSFLYLALITLALSGCRYMFWGSSDWEYEVSGTASHVSVAFSDDTGSLESYSDVQVPWTYSFSKDNIYSFSASISAQNLGNSGSITVKIYKNDKCVKTANSEGPFCVASAFYSK